MSYKQKYYKISKYIYLYIYCFTYLLYTCIYCIYLHLYWISMQIPLWTNTAFLSVHIFISFYSRNLLRLSVCVCICLFVFACVCPNTHTHTYTSAPPTAFTFHSIVSFSFWLLRREFVFHYRGCPLHSPFHRPLSFFSSCDSTQQGVSYSIEGYVGT